MNSKRLTADSPTARCCTLDQRLATTAANSASTTTTTNISTSVKAASRLLLALNLHAGDVAVRSLAALLLVGAIAHHLVDRVAAGI